MIKKKTFKSKLFWTGLGSVALGGALIYTGDKALGLQLLVAGLGMVTGSDRLTKVLEAMQSKKE